MSHQCMTVLFCPFNGIVYSGFGNACSELVLYRDSYPIPAVRGFNPVTILPAVLFKLHTIKKYKNIRTIHLVKISKPREIMGLMNSDNHPVILFHKRYSSYKYPGSSYADSSSRKRLPGVQLHLESYLPEHKDGICRNFHKGILENRHTHISHVSTWFREG